MRPDTFDQLKQLIDQALIDADKAFSKGVVSRARASRKALMEISRLCKQGRAELLEKVIHRKQKQSEDE